MKRTEWYPSSVNPVHVGEYEVELRAWPGFILRRVWTGQRWCFVDGIYAEVTGQWRGLTKPAERAA